MFQSQSSSDLSESTEEGCGADCVQNGQGSPHHLQALSGDCTAVAAVLPVVMEVAASVAGSRG